VIAEVEKLLHVRKKPTEALNEPRKS